MTSKIIFKNKSGLKLAGIWYVPKEKTDKAVILAHGITADKDEFGIFVELAELFKNNGFAVFRFDFRGHGESEGKSVDMTLTGEMEDLEVALNEVKNRDYKNIGLLGASFGGGISTLFVSDYQTEFKCLCLWNPTLNYHHCYLSPTKTSIRKFKAHIKNDIAKQGWAYLYGNTFKIGKALLEEMKYLFPYKALKKIGIPTVIIHGDKDSSVPYEDSQKYIQNLKGIHEFVSIKGSGYGFHDEPYSTQVINTTLKFFQKYL